MKTFLSFALVLIGIFSAPQNFKAAPIPLAPKGNDGRVLNLDFELGDLSDWKAEGAAFQKQPVQGDLVRQRQAAGGTSAHQGEYWIGGYEIGGDDLMGTLTSVPFKVTQPWASFRVAGGNWEKARVELADAKTGNVFFKISGDQSERLRPVIVDLAQQLGREIIIRLVDEQKGGWGHVNFDDFKFYAERPSFPDEIDPKKQSAIPEADKILYAGLSPEEAAAKMTLPPGFKATLYAGEPDVKQPIAFAIDDRGRLWVAEAYTYPKRAPEGEGKDRILVFDDTNGDGKFDKRTVFMEGLNIVSGIEVGFGGVWIGAAPYLMFVPMQDGDDPKPSGEPSILLDGFAYNDTHETLNTFTWGPDGWLYGCHGVFVQSNVGKPGAPDTERTRINAGVWRYHPVKHSFELFSEGTSNPWGIDFDEHGQCIIEACVIPHLFHMVQGGRFTRQAGSHFNPAIYDDIKTIADHVHYAGDKGPHAGNNRSGAAGGGHAHAGLMIYQGDNWPAEYRGKIFMNNIHGARINMDIAERKGSGFVGRHGADFAHFNDVWSQIINLQAGPDGAVYLIDWYDKNQCHHNEANGHDRSNGRIFKVSHGQTKFEKVDLQKLSDEELVNHFGSNNAWHARHAQRILQERAATGRLKQEDATRILAAASGAKSFSEDKSLRLLWAQHVTAGVSETMGLRNLKSEMEFVRAWTIQLLCEGKTVSPSVLKEFARLAKEDPSPVVRLYLASAAQRLQVKDRWEIVQALFSHGEDSNDHNLPLMYWYAAEAIVSQDITKAVTLLNKTPIALLRQFLARRVASLSAAE